MSIHDVAADQLKCVRVLSVILADGTLPTPGTWNMHTYRGYEPPFPPTLEGMFFDNTNSRTPTAKDLHALLDVYAEKFGLAVEEKPHGVAGLVGVHTRGRWQGVELHVWGPARKDDDPAVDDGTLRAADVEERHALMPDGTETPRCGAIGRVAVFAENVTCRTCRTLLAEQLGAPDGDLAEEDTGDAP